jgi:hypothetical protein
MERTAQTPHQASFRPEALKGIHQSNEVANVFFSRANLDALQQGIRYRVYVESGDSRFVIAPQSEDELKVVMRSIYLQHSSNLTVEVLEQVRELNRKVLDFCVPRVLNEARMYMTFQKDWNNQPTIMDHPQNVSNAGTKVLEISEY